MSKKVRVQMLGIAILAVVSSILLYEKTNAEEMFCTEEAVAAGYRKSKR